MLKALNTIIEVTKRKPDAKPACLELEEKIEQMLKVDEEGNRPIDDRMAMPPPPVPRQRKQSRRNKQQRNSSSEEDDEEEDQNDSDSENVPIQNITNHTPNMSKI